MAETQAQPSTLSQFSDELANVIERAARSIVTIAARPRQTATGILWRAETETIVLTADHVIEREDEITVTLPDKREVKAQLIGRDPSTDLAALRLPGIDLGTENVPAETSENLRVGHLVLAIGRPSSDGPRVSFGAVSSIDGPRRSWQGSELEGVIYPDVTLYPGFSGGPLVNLAGQVVGLNSSQLTRQNSSALPVVTLRRVANALVTHGRVQRGYLGVGTQQAALPAALAQKAGVTQQAALLIVTVEPGSPAEKAGLLIGDLLISLGGQPTTDGVTLRAQLGADRLGQPLAAKILRGGEPRDLSIIVAERS
ncbi:MAG TPA: trypsin-like peptidase domain-containing protein [Ktedonobacterales bacterium]|nr:trypsin-like peptidase domain-containing protein [Ktedonobacterales bacterium]